MERIRDCLGPNGILNGKMMIFVAVASCLFLFGKSLWSAGTVVPVFEFFKKYQIFSEKIPLCR
jgi:hypothetical protein